MTSESTIYQIVPGRHNQIVTGMPFAEYQQIVAMNPSSLVNGLESMKKLKWEWDRPSPSTSAMAFGSAVHMLCLEPRKFAQRYSIWSGSRRTKDYREFAANSWLDGKLVLTEAESEAVQQAGLAMVAHKEVQGLIRSGQAEVGVLWTEGDIQCKGRIDWITGSGAERQAIVDLKTAKDVSWRGRGRAFFKYHYDVKLGLYQRAVEKVTGSRYPVCVVWIQNEKPYDVVIDEGWIPQVVLDQGVERGLRVLKEVRRCLDTREWPGHGGALWTPPWEMEDELVEFYDDED